MKEKTISKYCVIACFLIILIMPIMIAISGYHKLDDIWHYNMSRLIADGKVMYKDFGCVTTPIYYYLMSIVCLFTKNPTIYLYINSLLSVTLSIISYKIIGLYQKEMTFEKLFVVSYITIYSVMMGLEYNQLAQIFYFCALYILLAIYAQKKENNFKNMFLVGIFLSLSFFSKQNLGFIFLIECFIIYLLIAKENKLKGIFYCFLGYLLPSVIILGYLIYNDAFNDFINYTILGLSKFNNNINVIDAICILIKKQSPSGYLLISTFMLQFLILIQLLINKNKTNLIIFIINLFYYINIIPIANSFHIYTLFVPLSITILYYLPQYITIHSKKIYIYIFYIILAIITIPINPNKIHKINNIYINNEDYKFAKDIYDYQISHKNEYFTPEDIFVLSEIIQGKLVDDKYLVEYLKGNLGTKDYVDALKEYQEKHPNALVYMYKDKDNILWQTPEEGIDYINENYTIIDSTKYFNIMKQK